MPPTGLQIYIRPHVTLNFDLLTPKVDRFMPLPIVDHVCQLASKLVHSFQSIVFTRLVTDEQTDGRTDGQVENIMPPPASLA